MGNSLSDLLGQVAAAGGRLLSAAREPLPGPAGGHASSRLRLCFDVGVLELRADGAALHAAPASLPLSTRGLISCDEEEPWWALLGNPLVRVQSNPDGSVLVQFRRDEDSPRRFRIAPERGGVAVRTQV